MYQGVYPKTRNMKWICILLFVVCATLPSRVNGQTINFAGSNVPLAKLFSVIKSQTGYVFFYNETLLKNARPLSIRLKNATLEKTLNEICRNQPFTWSVEAQTITLIPKQEFSKPEPEPTLPLLKPFLQVSGSVTDAQGNPLVNSSVVVKTTRRGKLTDGKGDYSIQAHKGDVLVFSSVGYTTREVAVLQAKINIELPLELKPLEALIVGGNMAAMKRKCDATSVTVLDSKTLQNIPATTLDQVFTGLVPGTNNINAGDEPEGFPGLTIRGAGGANVLSQIAVYVDGIEFAGGSGYLCALDKTNVERIEVVRGPGAATLYGMGSNGGIVQIFTKRNKPGQTMLNFSTGAGFYKSKWVPEDAFLQQHSIEAITGFEQVALTVGGSYRSVGAYLPGGGENNKHMYGSVRLNLGKLQANITGRYNQRNFSMSKDPTYDTAVHRRPDIILEPSPGLRVPAYEWLNVQPRPSVNKNGLTQTALIGINLSHRTAVGWVNNFEAGHTTNGTAELPVMNGSVSAQRQFNANRVRITTIRYSNVLQLKSQTGLSATLSSGAEYKKYSARKSYARGARTYSFGLQNPVNENYGVFVQANPSYKNVYLTLGLRYEKNNLFDAVWNPRIGLTTNFEKGNLIIKPKISWGRGITSPSFQHRYGMQSTASTVVYANPGIRPQAQQGFDYGIELHDQKNRYRFEVTRYDNFINNMITQIALGPDKSNPNVWAYQWVNVAALANNGWEFSGEYHHKRFSLSGTFSVMNSTVKDTSGSSNIATLRGKSEGVALPYLPTHTAGLNLTYRFNKLFAKSDNASISLNVTEVDGIRSYDYISYTMDVAYGRKPYIPGFAGEQVQSSPVFRLGLTAEYTVTDELRFFIQGSNILNDYKFEFSSDFPTHGATWLFGFRLNVTSK